MHGDKQGKICTAGFLRGISPRERRSAGTRRCDAITNPACESRDPLQNAQHDCTIPRAKEPPFMRIVSGIVLAVMATAALVAQSPMRPGLWEVTMQMQMPNTLRIS
jgi:hypothetical protein